MGVLLVCMCAPRVLRRSITATPPHPTPPHPPTTGLERKKRVGPIIASILPWQSIHLDASGLIVVTVTAWCCLERRGVGEEVERRGGGEERRGEETTEDRWKERKKSGGEKRGARLNSLF